MMKVTKGEGGLIVPDRPVIPFIEGDGIGKEITPHVRRIIDAAIEKSYGGTRKIEWWSTCWEKALTRLELVA